MKDIENSNEQTGQVELPQTNGESFAARRTIVKGMASAVPVVMTMGCGKALAQSSLSCVVTTPIPQNLAECKNLSQPDEWARVPATMSQCGGSGGSTSLNRLKLIYVDENGNAATSATGFPVTLSCYASFLHTTG
jgi:hypothetical protein